MGMRIFNFDNDYYIQTSFESYEESGCGLILELLIIFYQLCDSYPKRRGLVGKRNHLKSTTLVSITCLCVIEMKEKKDDYDIAITSANEFRHFFI